MTHFLNTNNRNNSGTAIDRHIVTMGDLQEHQTASRMTSLDLTLDHREGHYQGQKIDFCFFLSDRCSYLRDLNGFEKSCSSCTIASHDALPTPAS